MHSLVNLFQRWRYLFLLAALLALLVIQPIASAFGIMDSLFDVLFVVVMAVLVLALAQDKVWRVVACIACIPAATLFDCWSLSTFVRTRRELDCRPCHRRIVLHRGCRQDRSIHLYELKSFPGTVSLARFVDTSCWASRGG